MKVLLLMQARRKRGAGGFNPPNNLLKFVDFVSEKAVIPKVLGMKIETRQERRGTCLSGGGPRPRIF